MTEPPKTTATEVPPQVPAAPAAPSNPPPPAESPWKSLAAPDGDGAAASDAVRSRLDKLRAHVAKSPWDTDAWAAYLREAEPERSGGPDALRTALDDFLKQFPTSAKHWIRLAEFEMQNNAYDRVEKAFARCLRSVPSVDLHKCYTHYVQRVHSVTGKTPEEAKEANTTVINAFEFVLQNIGTDRKAGSIWMGYIRFVQSTETTSNYEDQKKMDQLRRIFHRAIHTPLLDIEQIWKDYDAFENNLSKLTGKKFVAEKAAGYMTARSALRDLKMLFEPIEKVEQTWLARPSTWTAHEVQLLAAWKRYIAWERSNPLQIEDKDGLVARLTYAFKSALLQLRFFPELWYDLAKYMSEMGMQEKSAEFLRFGIEVNPTSLLLSFTLAESEEVRRVSFKEIQPIFDNLLAKLEARHKEMHARYDEERAALLAQLREADNAGDDADESTWDGERRERERELERDREREAQERVEIRRERKNNQIRSAIGLVWVVYMRLARRTQDVKAARVVFSRARKSPLITYHVYVASALMEHHINKDPVVAGKIFELGMKAFSTPESSDASSYILHYIDFLISLNDDNNVRALFERALASLPAEHAHAIWRRFLSYESQFGDLGMLEKAEKRYEETYSGTHAGVNSLESVIHVGDRWRYLDINYIGEHELGVPALRTVPRKAPPATSIKAGGALMNTGTGQVDAKGRNVAMLVAVNPDRFPRPDFGRWAAYKPEPDQAKVAPVPVLKPTTPVNDGEARRRGPPSPEHAPAINAPAPEPVRPAMPDPDPVPQPPFPIPEPLAAVMSVLPRRDYFEGPTINVDEILRIVFQLPIPFPAVTPRMVPIPHGVPMPDTVPRHAGHDLAGGKRSGRWDEEPGRVGKAPRNF